MSSEKEAKEEAAGNSFNDLAAAIYVELVGRAFLRTENIASIKPEPAVLATLSFDLAIAFKKAEKTSRATRGPQNVGYDVKVADLANWDK